MNPEFVYSPLAEDDGIRLLLLQPATTRDEALRGSLQEISLSQHYDDLIEPFTALSYVWGDPTPVDKILLDNHELGIAANLSAALHDLRDTSRSYKLWVDAICINQDDIPERNKQVGLMGKIYSGANNTVIYLGQLNPYITAIIDLVKQQVHSSTSSAISVNPRVPYGDSGSEISLIDAMHKGLLLNPWFRRIWVLQELVLSREPWVQCGTNRVRWQDLCRLLAPQLGRHRRNEGGSKELTALESMNKIRLDYWGINGASSSDDPLKMSNSSSDNTLDDDSPDPRRRLWQILQSRKGSEVSDARDIIFGHMGVISDRRRAEKFIKIDYNLTTSEVLAAAGRYIYYCRGMDTMLSGITSSPLRESAALPTWVPDWGMDVVLQRASQEARVTTPAVLQSSAHAMPLQIVDAAKIVDLSGILPEPTVLREALKPLALVGSNAWDKIVDLLPAASKECIPHKSNLYSWEGQMAGDAMLLKRYPLTRSYSGSHLRGRVLAVQLNAYISTDYVGSPSRLALLNDGDIRLVPHTALLGDIVAHVHVDGRKPKPVLTVRPHVSHNTTDLNDVLQSLEVDPGKCWFQHCSLVGARGLGWLTWDPYTEHASHSFLDSWDTRGIPDDPAPTLVMVLY